MARQIRVRLYDKVTGELYHWTIQHETVRQLGAGKSRTLSGWTITDHEGYQRFIEGKWWDLIPQFHVIADNYGLRSNLS